MKNWKKQWKTELDGIIPELSEEVKSTPFNLPETSTPVNSPKRGAKLQFKRGLVTAFLAIAITVIACVSGVLVPLLNNNDGGDGDGYTPAVMTVEINPKATFVLNEDGTVKDIVALNADADIILSDKKRVGSIEGKSVAVAVETFVNYSAQLGFIDLDNADAIRLSHTGDWNADWITSTKAGLKTYFGNHNIKTAVVNEEVTFAEFCTRSGIDGLTNVTEVADWISSTQTLYQSRIVDTTSEADLQQTYINGIVKEGVISELTTYLQSVVADVSATKTTLAQAIARYDYLQIRSIMNRFSLKYGNHFNSLDNTFAFFELVDQEMSGIISSLATVTDGASLKNVIEEIERVFLFDLSAYKGLTTAPETKEQFVEKQSALYNIQFNKLMNANRGSFETVREDFDYDEWENSFIGQVTANGGFGNYWGNNSHSV